MGGRGKDLLLSSVIPNLRLIAPDGNIFTAPAALQPQFKNKKKPNTSDARTHIQMECLHQCRSVLQLLIIPSYEDLEDSGCQQSLVKSHGFYQLRREVLPRVMK